MARCLNEPRTPELLIPTTSAKLSLQTNLPNSNNQDLNLQKPQTHQLQPHGPMPERAPSVKNAIFITTEIATKTIVNGVGRWAIRQRIAGANSGLLSRKHHKHQRGVLGVVNPGISRKISHEQTKLVVVTTTMPTTTITTITTRRQELS